jgi:uncharacterized protein (DUF58 family)
VTRHASPRVAAYAALAALGLLAALALRRPELAALAAPFAGVLALGLATTRPPQLGLWLTLGRERAIEGDDVEASIELNASAPVERLEVLLALPPGLETVAGENPVSVRLGSEEE